MGLSQDSILRKLFRIVNYGLELLLVRLYNKSFLGSRDVVAQFHSLYYCSPERTWNNTRYEIKKPPRLNITGKEYFRE